MRSFSNKQTGSRVHARDDNQKECYPLVFAGTERSGLCCLLGSYLKGHTGRFLSSIRCFPFFITTDPGLRLSRMTATTNNGFPTTTFGNDNKNRIRTRQLSSPRGWRPAGLGDLLWPLLFYNNRYWNAPRRQTFQYDLYFYKQPTTQAVDSENPAGRQFRMTLIFLTVLFF